MIAAACLFAAICCGGGDDATNGNGRGGASGGLGGQGEPSGMTEQDAGADAEGTCFCTCACRYTEFGVKYTSLGFYRIPVSQCNGSGCLATQQKSQECMGSDVEAVAGAVCVETSGASFVANVCEVTACGDQATGGASGQGGTGGSGAAGVSNDVVCGNGRLDTGEACDDGNPRMGDGCNGACQLEPNYACDAVGAPCVSTIRCGNGVVDVGEACDDGNTQDGDGCALDCSRTESGWICATPGFPCNVSTGTPLSVCGNGVVEAPEQCDDGVNDGTYGTCTPGCVLAARCGDGVVQGPEDCDDGENTGAYGACGPLCRPGPHCGDGILQLENEACDDGNDQGGHGCTALCRLESP